jgi:hypothetical protein
VAGLVLCLLVAVVVALVVQARRPQQAVLPGQDGRSASPDAPSRADLRGDAAGALLERLSARLRNGTREQVLALAAPGDTAARRELAALRENIRRVRVTDLTFRYVDNQAREVGAARRRALGGDAWVGQVQMTWRVGGFDRRDSTREVPMTFVRRGSRAGFVTARGGGGATPLWMLDRVYVDRSPRSLVVTTRPGRLPRFHRLADQAVADVRKVLPRWRGRLVVEVPPDQHGLTRVLGSKPDAYREIAAVTTTVDGSLTPGTPVHIFVNPRVFDPLGPRGSQIVMSHEATHVAVRAAFSTMPTWLLEGFADYVALAHVDLPVSVTASQILRQVRKHGPPRHLPGQHEFDLQNQALGASYESAWLACRLLAEEYGEKRLIAFYRASARADSTRGPFRSVLGTDVKAFTRAWRDDLRGLAR